MEKFTLKARKRTETGKKYTHKLRKEGYVPAVVYGGGENLLCEIDVRDLRHLIYTDKVYLVELDFGKEKVECIKKEEQFHPITDELLHLDFLRIFDDKKVKINIPVKTEGFSKGVQDGGHLYQLKRYLQIQALPKNVPDNLVIDVTDIALGKSIKISDLDIKGIEILDRKSDVVVLVKLTRAAMSEADSETEEEGATEETEAEEKE